jgi:hypothetical protein
MRKIDYSPKRRSDFWLSQQEKNASSRKGFERQRPDRDFRQKEEPLYQILMPFFRR